MTALNPERQSFVTLNFTANNAPDIQKIRRSEKNGRSANSQAEIILVH